MRLCPAAILVLFYAPSATGAPFAIEVVEQETGWPVPLVELRTTHEKTFVTDNLGLIAFDLPELMNKETWFHIRADGYGVPKDGFGYRGVRTTPRPGGKLRIEVKRTMIAKRIGRLTGAGRFAEGSKLGREPLDPETGVLGCDSVQVARYGGKLHWFWGDTSVARYPLGVFHMTGATTVLEPLGSQKPPLQLSYSLFVDEKMQPRAVAKLEGKGPTWLSAIATISSKSGEEKMVGTYAKIKPPLEAYERGLCVWHEPSQQFRPHKVIWKQSDSSPRSPPLPDGHAAVWTDETGTEWLLFGNPLPVMKVPATFEAWENPQMWQEVLRPKTLQSATGEPIEPHTGSIAWNDFRKRWVTVFMQKFGNPSAFGELWYAEAKSPFGPWGKAVKVLSHANYTFYNPRVHAELSAAGSPILLFEGTYTVQFANKPAPTPRYDYNQILYRLDLDDPKLAPARGQ